MSRDEEATEVVDPKQVALKMKLDYSRGVKDHSVKSVEALSELLWMLERPGFDLPKFLKDAAECISKQFGISSVAICAKDVDGKYRYKVVLGLTEEATKGFDQFVYTREELFDSPVYPGHEISRHTKIFLTEDHPYGPGEEFTYQRPGLIGMKRRSLTESLEADYLDFFFFGPNGEPLGYIETSGTRLRKLPDGPAIVWIEHAAAIVGVGVWMGSSSPGSRDAKQ